MVLTPAEKQPQPSPEFPRRRAGAKQYLGCLAPLLLLVIPAAAMFVYSMWAEGAYHKHAEDIAALGETFDPLKLAPPPVDDELNFAMAPIAKILTQEHVDHDAPANIEGTMARLFSMNGIPGYETPKRGNHVSELEIRPLSDSYPGLSETEAARRVIDYLAEHAEEIAAMRDALARPQSNFEIAYENLMATEFPSFSWINSTTGLLFHHGKAAIVMKNEEMALRDALDLLRLQKHTGTEPALIGHLVSLTCYIRANQLIGEGLRNGVWGDESRDRLQAALADRNFGAHYQTAIRMERATMVQAFLSLGRNPRDLAAFSNNENPILFTVAGPAIKGWMYDNARFLSELYQAEVLTDRAGNLLYDRARRSNDLEAILDSHRKSRIKRYRYLMATLSLPVVDSIRIRFLEAETRRRQTRLALYLADYEDAHGEYPDSLGPILADAGEDLILDPMTGVPMIYETLPDGEYQIYSVGANGIDEGGLLRKDREDGDWVWRLSLPADFDRDDWAGR